MKILGLTIALLISTMGLSQSSFYTSSVVHIGVDDDGTGDFTFGDPVHTKSSFELADTYIMVDERKCIIQSSNVSSERVIFDCTWEDGYDSRIVLTNDDDFNYMIFVINDGITEVYELD